MALDTRYVLLQDPQALFRDKTTGLPLRNGYIEFYKDSDRSTPNKPVYRITGNAPNYSYVALPNPLPLTGIGSYSDGYSNDIAIYFFPYESTASGAPVELYYMRVYDEDGVFQFDREAWPNIGSDSSTEQYFYNYVPNGQFLFHNNLPAYGQYVAGQIREPITVLGQGGWTFERPTLSTATDIVTFGQFAPGITRPTGNPRFYCRINCQSPTPGDTYKDLRLKFPDVNKFSSNTQKYTFGFYGITNVGFSTQVQLVLIKNYGSGGDSPTTEVLQTFNVSSAAYNLHQYSFYFGDNTGKNIGTDDYLQLVLRFPGASGFDVSISCVMLGFGEFTIINFPTETNSDMMYKSIPGWLDIPDYRSKNLYLPLVLTPTGLTYDNSQVGKLFIKTDFQGPEIGELQTDGSQYEYAAVSPDGIPYSRLGDKYWNATANCYDWGTGRDYFTAAINSAETEVRIVCNSGGLVTDIADGAAPHQTGFAFLTAHTGASTYYVASYYNAGNPNYNTFTLINQQPGSVTAPTAGDSGFSVNFDDEANTFTLTQFRVEFTAVTPGTLAGKYFTFESLNGGTPVPYAPWFKVGVSGTPPSVPGYTLIEIDLNADYAASDVAQVVREALNGWQISTVRPLAAASVPAGSYFNVSATGGNYYVWFKVAGNGSDPAPAGRTGIEVDLQGTETIAQVCAAIQSAINRKFYAVPDTQNAFIRSYSTLTAAEAVLGIYDPGPRLTYFPGYGTSSNTAFATYEFDQNREHVHLMPRRDDLVGGGPNEHAVNNNNVDQIPDFPSGNAESRPVNIAFPCVVKY